jgi:hypothetical protein
MVPLVVAAFTLCPSPTAAVEANRMPEVNFASEAAYANPFNEVTIDAVFTTPEGKLLRVPAFWAGGKMGHGCYTSEQPSTHRDLSEYSGTTNAGQWGGRTSETNRLTGTPDLLSVAGGGIMVHASGRIAHGCEVVFKGGQVGRDSFFRERIGKNTNPK